MAAPEPSAVPVSHASIHVSTAEAMQRLGERLGRAAQAGDRLLLDGPFGAGKTTLVQGLAHGLGVAGDVTSPSFVIETQYRGRLTLYHLDLFRLEAISPEMAEELGEHLFGDGVSAVEWPAALPEELTDGATRLTFAVLDDATRRVAIEGDPRLVAAAAA